MSAFLQRQGCKTVGFGKSRWRVVIDGQRFLLGAHIDDFVIACTNRPVLDAFQKCLLEAFKGTCEGPLEHYLVFEIAHNYIAGTTKALRRGDFAIIWILGYFTAQHTYETQHSPFKR